MRIYVATTNAGKLREFRSLMEPFGVAAVPPSTYDAPEEGERSYEENAARKARALRVQLARTVDAEAVIADDSGLEIDALAGAPGVLTARFGGPGLSWAERRAFVLARLRDVAPPQRGARFVCAVHVIDRDGAERSARGVVEGAIALEERGEAGFSFDPIFYYPPQACTFAEMTQEQKDRVSHRARALAQLFGVRADA